MCPAEWPAWTGHRNRPSAPRSLTTSPVAASLCRSTDREPTNVPWGSLQTWCPLEPPSMLASWFYFWTLGYIHSVFISKTFPNYLSPPTNSQWNSWLSFVIRMSFTEHVGVCMSTNLLPVNARRTLAGRLLCDALRHPCGSIIVSGAPPSPRAKSRHEPNKKGGNSRAPYDSRDTYQGPGTEPGAPHVSSCVFF